MSELERAWERIRELERETAALRETVEAVREWANAQVGIDADSVIDLAKRLGITINRDRFIGNEGGFQLAQNIVLTILDRRALGGDTGGDDGRRESDLMPLSPEALAARKPQPPEELVGALQDRVHVGVGRARPGRAARGASGEGGDDQ